MVEHPLDKPSFVTALALFGLFGGGVLVTQAVSPLFWLGVVICFGSAGFTVWRYGRSIVGTIKRDQNLSIPAWEAILVSVLVVVEFFGAGYLAYPEIIKAANKPPIAPPPIIKKQNPPSIPVPVLPQQKPPAPPTSTTLQASAAKSLQPERPGANWKAIALSLDPPFDPAKTDATYKVKSVFFNAGKGASSNASVRHVFYISTSPLSRVDIDKQFSAAMAVPLDVEFLTYTTPSIEQNQNISGDMDGPISYLQAQAISSGEARLYVFASISWIDTGTPKGMYRTEEFCASFGNEPNYSLCNYHNTEPALKYLPTARLPARQDKPKVTLLLKAPSTPNTSPPRNEQPTRGLEVTGLSNDLKKTLLAEIAPLKPELPAMLINRGVAGGGSPLLMDFAEVFDRAGISPTTGFEEPSGPDQVGVMLAVQDLNNVPQIAKKIKAALEKIGIDAPYIPLPKEASHIPQTTFAIFIGPPKL